MCFQCVVVPTTRKLEVEHMALLSEGDVGRGNGFRLISWEPLILETLHIVGTQCHVFGLV